MDNQPRIKPQPFLKILTKQKSQLKKCKAVLLQLGVWRAQGTCDFWALVADSELCKYPLVQHEPVLLLLPPQSAAVGGKACFLIHFSEVKGNVFL